MLLALPAADVVAATVAISHWLPLAAAALTVDETLTCAKWGPLAALKSLLVLLVAGSGGPAAACTDDFLQVQAPLDRASGAPPGVHASTALRATLHSAHMLLCPMRAESAGFSPFVILIPCCASKYRSWKLGCGTAQSDWQQRPPGSFSTPSSQQAVNSLAGARFQPKVSLSSEGTQTPPDLHPKLWLVSLLL